MSLELSYDFVFGRIMNPTDILTVLREYGCIDLVGNLRTGTAIDYFWEYFTIVEQSKNHTHEDEVWIIYRHDASGTFYKQLTYYDSYFYKAKFCNSYWTQVTPHLVTTTQYTDV